MNPSTTPGQNPRTSVKPTTDKQAAVLFCLMSFASFILIYLTPPSTQDLFPAFQYVWETGIYPDGLSIRRAYTGLKALDEILTGLAGFFSAAVDGRDEATRMFCLWFLPQLCTVLVFLYWEAARTSARLVSMPTVFGMLAQLITAGVVLPLYFALHICEVPPVPGTRKMYSATRVRMLFPAIALGFLLPSAFLFLFSAGDAASLDRKQIIAAAWQPFPVYVAAVYRLLCGSTSYMPTEASEDTSTQLRTFPHLRNVYMSSGLLSMLAHWAILVPSLLTTDAAYSFVHVFVPYPLHSYLGVTPSTLPSYRLSIRLLFQNDWLTTMVAAFIFFGYIRLDTQKLGNWMLHVAKWTVLGGPGAAMAWAAVDREEHINSVRLNRQFSDISFQTDAKPADLSEKNDCTLTSPLCAPDSTVRN